MFSTLSDTLVIILFCCTTILITWAVVSGSRDSTLRVWDIENGECMKALQGHVAAVRWWVDLLKQSNFSLLAWYNLDVLISYVTLSGSISFSVQFDGKLVVSGAYDYLVKVWDPLEGSCLHTLSGHTNRVYSLQVLNINFNTLCMHRRDYYSSACVCLSVCLSPL